MLDRSIPYYDIIMKADMSTACFHPITKLPAPYHFKMYEPGDEVAWANLELSVGEFNSIDEATAYFKRVFLPHQNLLPERMCFIVNETNEIVATTTAWFKQNEQRRFALLHWVATSPNHQGKGLGKAIVAYALSKFPLVEKGEDELFLHTQTWSYKAIGLYAKLGFKISDTPLMEHESNPLALPILKAKLDHTIYSQLF